MINRLDTTRLTNIALLLAISVVFGACNEEAQGILAEDEQRFVLPTEEGNWILVDQIHTTKQNPDLKLKRDDYAYQGMHGYNRLFKHLESNDYPYSQIVYTEADERLTPTVLNGFKVLFINLVSSDRPDFTANEIETIIEWVRGGGGLFVIADHTNVYYHAERINPFLMPMGIEVLFHTALDRSPDYSIAGGAWLKIRDWDRTHPVSKDVEIASFQTGGAFNTPHGVAFMSENGFGDFWEEDPNDPGFYGNWSKEPGEPEGALPVVAAAEFGQGRVVVVGDQNIFGDEWLLVAHNLELALNAFEWLAKNEDAEVPLRDTRDPKAYHVGFPLEQSDWNIGINHCPGFFPFYINFNRSPEVTARGTLDFTGEEDALVFTDPGINFTEEDIAAIGTYVDAGKPVVIMTDVTIARSGTRQLLEALVPEFSITGSGEPMGIDALPATDEQVETILGEEEFPILSTILDTEGMSMSGHLYPPGTRCPDEVADAVPYMRQVTGNFGEPFLQAEVPGGGVVDVARRIVRPSGGQVIVFLQDGFWRNETLGKERQSPNSDTLDAHHIEYGFVDWLVTQGPGALR